MSLLITWLSPNPLASSTPEPPSPESSSAQATPQLGPDLCYLGLFPKPFCNRLAEILARKASPSSAQVRLRTEVTELTDKCINCKARTWRSAIPDIFELTFVLQHLHSHKNANVLRASSASTPVYSAYLPP